MKFIQRLGYYLGGFAIGLILLMFFLNGKEASCAYGPNARTVKNIMSKTIKYSDQVNTEISAKSIDTTIVKQLIQYGDVNFSESDTKSEPCKTYKIENTYKERNVVLLVKNCDSIATIENLKLN